MAHQDRYGLTLSTNSSEAAAAYREGVDLLLAAWPGAAEAFERGRSRSRFCAGAYRASPHSYLLPAGRRGPAKGGAGA